MSDLADLHMQREPASDSYPYLEVFVYNGDLERLQPIKSKCGFHLSQATQLHSKSIGLYSKGGNPKVGYSELSSH